MIVSKLIEILKQYPPNTKVVCFGIDSGGDSTGDIDDFECLSTITIRQNNMQNKYNTSKYLEVYGRDTKQDIDEIAILLP